MQTRRLLPVSLAIWGTLLLSKALVSAALPVGFTTAKPMATPRVLHTATLLPNGKVLVAGGIITNRPASRTASAEAFDPVTGEWTSTAAMSSARMNHTATLLPNGAVLVAGGDGDHDAPRSAELYEPATGIWRKTGPLNTPRKLASATLLPSGKVLITGG